MVSNTEAQQIESDDRQESQPQPLKVCLVGANDRIRAMMESVFVCAGIGNFRLTEEDERGSLRQVFLEGKLGSILLMHTGTEAVLAVTVRPNVDLGMVMIEARSVAEQVHDLFS